MATTLSLLPLLHLLLLTSDHPHSLSIVYHLAAAAARVWRQLPKLIKITTAELVLCCCHVTGLCGLCGVPGCLVVAGKWNNYPDWCHPDTAPHCRVAQSLAVMLLLKTNSLSLKLVLSWAPSSYPRNRMCLVVWNTWRQTESAGWWRMMSIHPYRI